MIEQILTDIVHFSRFLRIQRDMVHEHFFKYFSKLSKPLKEFSALLEMYAFESQSAGWKWNHLNINLPLVIYTLWFAEPLCQPAYKQNKKINLILFRCVCFKKPTQRNFGIFISIERHNSIQNVVIHTPMHTKNYIFKRSFLFP